MGRYGCTTTCIADLSTYFKDNLDPLQTSKICQYTPAGLILWGSCKFPNFEFERREHGRNDANIRAALKDPDRAVILEVANSSHWVVATGYDWLGRLKIADPWLGDFTTVTRYKNITGAAYFKRVKKLPVGGTIRVARIGSNLPSGEELKAQVSHLTKGKLSLVLVDYNVPLTDSGMITQDEAYALVDKLLPKETFVQLYYNSPNAPFLTSYFYPNKNKYISTLANNPSANLIAFELAHCLQFYCNEVFKAQIQVNDSNFPDEAFTQRKYDLVEPYLSKII